MVVSRGGGAAVRYTGYADHLALTISATEIRLNFFYGNRRVDMLETLYLFMPHIHCGLFLTLLHPSA